MWHKWSRTGLRPGEKLYEELLISESDKKTQFDSITIAQARKYDIEQLIKQIDELINCRTKSERISKLKEIVPEFKHNLN
ncbi:MAG: polysaccharide biosynthesis protein [Candidatus Delongbacteria bacterium]